MKWLLHIIICLIVLLSCDGGSRTDRMVTGADTGFSANHDTVNHAVYGDKYYQQIAERKDKELARYKYIIIVMVLGLFIVIWYKRYGARKRMTEINGKSFDSSEHEREIMNMPVVAHFHKLAAKLGRPTEEEWTGLEQLILEVLPGFYAKITDGKYSLDEREKRVCILVRLYFVPSEISVLLNISKQSVTNLRSKINKKLFGLGGTKCFDSNIRRL